MNASPHRTAEPREQLERATADALANLDYGPPITGEDAEDRAYNSQWFLSVLTPYSDDTLQRLITAAPTRIGGGLRDLLVGTKPDEEYLNDWMTVEAFIDGYQSGPIVKGLPQYKTLTPYHGGHYPARRAEQVLAITRVTAHFEDIGDGVDYDVNTHDFHMEYIEDEKLRELLTTHENPGAVADIIIQRDIKGVEQITALINTMNATPNALTNGVI